MTTLNATSRIVVMNNTLSDLSFRAIYSSTAFDPKQLPSATKIAMSGQQSSVGGVEAPASQAGAAWVPSSQPSTAHRPMTAHSSQLRELSPFGYQLSHLRLEHPSPLRIVVEHVEARAGGREQHDP